MKIKIEKSNEESICNKSTKQMSKSTNSDIYRFKFSPNILNAIQTFTNVHKYDEPDIFREHWEMWTKENIDIIRREKVVLEKSGYDGNVEPGVNNILGLDMENNGSRDMLDFSF